MFQNIDHIVYLPRWAASIVFTVVFTVVATAATATTISRCCGSTPRINRRIHWWINSRRIFLCRCDALFRGWQFTVVTLVCSCRIVVPINREILRVWSRDFCEKLVFRNNSNLRVQEEVKQRREVVREEESKGKREKDVEEKMDRERKKESKKWMKRGREEGREEGRKDDVV